MSEGLARLGGVADDLGATILGHCPLPSLCKLLYRHRCHSGPEQVAVRASQTVEFLDDCQEYKSTLEIQISHSHQ